MYALCYNTIGGEGGIRTLGTSKGTTDFESAPFDHSGTSPIIMDHSFAMLCIAVQQISFVTSL